VHHAFLCLASAEHVTLTAALKLGPFNGQLPFEECWWSNVLQASKPAGKAGRRLSQRTMAASANRVSISVEARTWDVQLGVRASSTLKRRITLMFARPATVLDGLDPGTS